MAIDIGRAAIRGGDYGFPPPATLMNGGNPANGSGKITSVEIWARENLTECEVATFYRPNPDNFPNNLSTRDSHLIGNVTAGSKQTFTELDIAVRTNDYLGIYYTSGEFELYHCAGDTSWVIRSYTKHIPCDNYTFGTIGNTAFSLYGTGIELLLATTQSPTNVLPNAVTANGNIISLYEGTENATVRGFKYGLTKTDTWDVHETDEVDGFGVGAYTKAITGLEANTTYWIQSYVEDGVRTSHGEWVQFQTAAAGGIPTGTKINICSDYSGYTYQLQRSETDDGEAYTAYFVISTDLTNKQALAFYKRILDLHLYFRNEDSGTVTIEVKRDSEAEWQPVGSVSLEGDEDIIVKHLATDIRAKHFLFKISAANKFRFLGCLYEYIPEGMR